MLFVIENSEKSRMREAKVESRVEDQKQNINRILKAFLKPATLIYLVS